MSTGSVLDNSQEGEITHASQAAPKIPQQPAPKFSQMKIHNITMTTHDKQQILLTTSTETVPGKPNGKGPITGKMTQKSPKNRSVSQQHIQPALTPPLQIQSKPVTSSNVQILASNQILVTQVNNQSNSLTQTFSTVGKPITTPVQIASKPLVSVHQANMGGMATTLKAGVTGMQQSLLQNSVATTTGKGMGTIVLQPATVQQQYNMAILSPSPVNNLLAKSSVAQPQNALQTNVQGGSFITTIRNLAPTANQNAQPHTPTQTAAPATLLTNLVLKSTNQTIATHSVQNVPAQQQHNMAPTQIQYILPSVRVATPNGGKMQNVLQMALPGGQVQQVRGHLWGQRSL